MIQGDTGHTALFFGDSHMQQYWPRHPVRHTSDKGRAAELELGQRRLRACTWNRAPIAGVRLSFVTEGFARPRSPMSKSW